MRRTRTQVEKAARPLPLGACGELCCEPTYPLLFRLPTGLAVGLALKELALRHHCGDSPLGAWSDSRGVPRSPGAVATGRLGWVIFRRGKLSDLQDGCHHSCYGARLGGYAVTVRSCARCRGSGRSQRRVRAVRAGGYAAVRAVRVRAVRAGGYAAVRAVRARAVRAGGYAQCARCAYGLCATASTRSARRAGTRSARRWVCGGD